MVLRFSNGALDKIATDLSFFTSPEIPELSLKDDKTLQNNMLAGVIGAFSGDTNAHIRYLVNNVVRRVYASIETYRLGRKHALDYVEGDRKALIGPYFLALTNFESCVSYSWQIADFLCQLSKQKIYQKNDGSAWERLHDIYTVGTKHSFRKYDLERVPPRPTSVWLTDEGIECMNGAFVTYQELAEIIEANNEFFYTLQAKAIEKRRRKRVGA